MSETGVLVLASYIMACCGGFVLGTAALGRRIYRLHAVGRRLFNHGVVVGAGCLLLAAVLVWKTQ